MSVKIFAAVSGMDNYYGAQAFHVGDTLYLVKTPIIAWITRQLKWLYHQSER